MTLSDINPPAATINYPPVPRSRAQLGYKFDIITTAQVDLLQAGGATLARMQFAWSDIQNATTGAFALTAGETAVLQYCATKGVQPMLVAAFGPPWTTIGTLTVNTLVPADSPGGTPIPVNGYGFTIQPNSTDFAGGLNFGFPTGLTSATAYYGDIISFADSGSIQLGRTINTDLTPGTTLSIQRLRYAPPFSDADPSIAAYVSYVMFLANQLAANGCTGYIDIWNEYVWGHDRWPEPGSVSGFYDSTPPGYTLTGRMNAILTALQAQTLPDGVKLINGVSDKSGSNGIAAQGITGTNFSHDSIHPYGNSPEASCISPFGWGGTIGQFPGSTAHWDAAHDSAGWNGWDSVIPADESGNFRAVSFHQQFKPGGPYAPDVMITESGFATANDTQQARWLTRMVLANWGNGYPGICVFQLDGGQAPGSNTYATAPRATPRQSYTALARIMAVIARMDTATAQTAAPCAVGWPSTGNPLMSTTVSGNQAGNYVVFAWQRTWANTASWAAIDSPTSRPVSIYLPAGLLVAEALNVVSGATVSVTTVNSTLITVPLTDDPVAIRFAPA